VVMAAAGNIAQFYILSRSALTNRLVGLVLATRYLRATSRIEDK
jgi:hypothetical protein